MKSIVPAEFVAIDIETTGLNSRHDDIIEIAAVLFRKGEPAGAFSTLVRTKKTLPAFIVTLTGITQEDLEAGKEPKEALAAFSEFAGERPLVAHNISFDTGFISNKLAALKLPSLKNACFDTLLFSRLALPGQPSYKLENLSKALGISENSHHRAEADAKACGRLFVLALSALCGLPEEKLAALSRLVRHQDSDTGRLLSKIVPETAPPAAKPRPRPAIPEPLQPLESAALVAADTIDTLFKPGGSLAGNLEAYEFRPGQLKMAQAVRRAFNENGLLCVEAGTGTGKSLAYLAAAALFASTNNARVIISTRTRQLQDQIFKKEIPFLREKAGFSFSATVLKGRSNYLCMRKWKETLGAAQLMLRGWEADELLPLTLWAEETESGDIAECGSFNERENRILWARIASDSESCQGSRCPWFGECFIMRKRKEALGSHIVLVNHSLFFTDMKAGGSVLGAFSRIIFDEAHTLEETGCRHLGEEISHLLFSTALQKLYKRDEGGHGLLRYLAALASKAGANTPEAQLRIQALFNEVADAELASVHFFRSLGSALRKMKTDKLRYKGDFMAALESSVQPLDLTGLVSRLRKLGEELKEGAPEDEALDNVLFDVEGVLKELEGLSGVMARLLKAADETRVFWAEVGNNPLNMKLFSSPLEIRDTMAAFLSRSETAVFTSATLAVGENLEYFLEKMGLLNENDGRLEKLVIGSHFDFNRQLFFAAVKGLPFPDQESFAAEVAAMVVRLSRTFRKRLLVLFTSRDTLRRVYDASAEPFREMGLPLLAQDISGTGYFLLEEMKRVEGSVLLGNASFWEGVDLPGDSLELLVIVRLPFSVPTDPLVQARSEKCEAGGKSGFGHLALPDAVIKFRQGVGRLIRRQGDTGAALVLDTRLIEKPYGRVFARSIDSELRVYTDRESLFSEMVSWFKRAG